MWNTCLGYVVPLALEPRNPIEPNQPPTRKHTPHTRTNHQRNVKPVVANESGLGLPAYKLYGCTRNQPTVLSERRWDQSKASLTNPLQPFTTLSQESIQRQEQSLVHSLNNEASSNIEYASTTYVSTLVIKHWARITRRQNKNK